MNHLMSFAAGILFAAGLVLSGMTQPAKVIGFLDFTGGAWDPSLALVMVGALAVYGITFRLITRRSKPVMAESFTIPTSNDLSARLFIGAALFGVGWGLSGFCPGPAIVSMGSGMTEALFFVPGMVGGMLLYRAWNDLAARPTDDALGEVAK